MIRLVSHLKSIARETGLDVPKTLGAPRLHLDGMKNNTPLLVECGGRKTLLIRLTEIGHLARENLKVDEIVYYHPYFTFENALEREKMRVKIEEALEEVIGGKDQPITIQEDLPLARYQALGKKFKIHIAGGKKIEKGINLYSIKKGKVRERFLADRARAETISMKFVSPLESGAVLSRYIRERIDSRFEKLDRFMSQEGLGALILSSPVNLQEVAGFWHQGVEGEVCLALYTPGRRDVRILTTRRLDGESFALMKKFGSLKDAAKDLIPGDPVGIEEESLCLGDFLHLGLEKKKIRPLTVLLRRWKEERAGEDLPYYIIATHATKCGIEGALDFAAEKIEKGDRITERDVEKRCFELMKKFKADHRIPGRLRPYFHWIHAGTRTIYPTMPSDYALNKDIHSLKLDLGVLLLNKYSLIQACSDLCRSLAFTGEGKEIYSLSEKAMLERAIPAAKPGVSAEGVYVAGTAAIGEEDEKLKAFRILPKEETFPHFYARNIGHLMGKQEPSSLVFERGCKSKLQAGMVGCVEYQWSFQEHSIAIEDSFFVAQEGALNFTR